MVHHFLILWDTKTNEAVYAERVEKPDCWEGVLLFMIGEVNRLGLSKRIEIIHSSGILSQCKTFRRDDIEFFSGVEKKIDEIMEAEG